MQLSKRVLFLLGLFLCASLALASEVRVKASKANIRAEPSRSAKVVGSVSAGETLGVLASSGEWVKVASGGLTGWIHNSLVEALPEKTTAKAGATRGGKEADSGRDRDGGASSGGSSTPSAGTKKVSFGGQVDWGSKTDIGVGARVRYDLGQVARGLGVVGSFDLFFPGSDAPEGVEVDASYWEVNLNATYDLASKGSVVPYGGAGLVLAHAGGGGSAELPGDEAAASTSASKIGANILAGATYKIGARAKIFAEAKYEVISDGSQVVVSAGVRF